MQYQSRGEVEPRSKTIAHDGALRLQVGSQVRIRACSSLGHHTAPIFACGKGGVVDAVICPSIADHRDKGRVRACHGRHFYRIEISLAEIWPACMGESHDSLYLECRQCLLGKA
jgi:hypothetical protein